MTQLSEKEIIVKVLKESHVIAVVGLSNEPTRPSYKVAQYLQNRGYRIIPVNPNVLKVLGEWAYPDLLSIPDSTSIDIVDIFRRPEAVQAIVEQAIAIKAKAIWMQKGVRNEVAAEQARAAGLLVVMDRCIMEEARQLIAEGALPN